MRSFPSNLIDLLLCRNELRMKFGDRQYFIIYGPYVPTGIQMNPNYKNN